MRKCAFSVDFRVNNPVSSSKDFPFNKPSAIDQIFAPPPIHMLNSNAQCDAIWRAASGRWSTQEDRASVNELSALTKETPESSVPPAPWGHSEEMATQKPGSRLTRHCVCGRLGLGLPASRVWEINVCCLGATQPLAFCYSRPICWTSHKARVWFIYLKVSTLYDCR